MTVARFWTLVNSETQVTAPSPSPGPGPGKGKGPPSKDKGQPPAGWTGRGRGGGWGKGGKTGSAAAPENTVAPTISGDTAVGSTLTTTDGTWTGDPTPTFTYQWTRDNVDISGATSSTYETVEADAGTTIRSKVTGTNSEGSATATSSNSITVDSNGFDGVLDIAIVRLAAPTHGTPTTQDFTVEGFGTPKAAIFLTGWVDTDDTAASNMSSSFGATDGTNQWFAHTSSQHNAGVGASTRKRVGNNDGVGALTVGTTGIDAKLAVNSIITDGVRVDWTYPGSSDSTGKFVTCILIGGSAVSAAAGVATGATQNNSTTITPGFQTNVGIFHTHLGTLDGTVGNVAFETTGFATFDGSTLLQAGEKWWEPDGTDPTQVNRTVRNDAVTIKAGVATDYIEAANVTSTAIDLTSRGSSFATVDVGYLLLNIGSGTAWAGVLDSPTATGIKSFENPAIEPIFGLIGFSMAQTLASQITTSDAQSFGWGAFTENEEISNGYFVQDAKTLNHNTKSWASQKAVSFTNDGSAAAFAGTLDSLDADGANINFTTADGTVRKWPALFIGRG